MLEESLNLNKLFVEILQKGDSTTQDYVWNWFLKRAHDPIKNLDWKMSPYQPISINSNLRIDEEDLEAQLDKLALTLTWDLSATDFFELACEGDESLYFSVVEELKQKILDVCSLRRLLEDKQECVKRMFSKKVKKGRTISR